MHYKTPHLSSNSHHCTLTGDVITRDADQFEADTQAQDTLDVSPEIAASMATYIFTGVSLTVIRILVLYFFVTRLCKSSHANEEE
jgi:hypothetical protein